MGGFGKRATFSTDEYAKRRKKFREVLRKQGLDGLLVTNLHDIRYLCGFSGSNALILLLRRSGYFMTDFRYSEQSREEVIGLRTLIYEVDFVTKAKEILAHLQERANQLDIETNRQSSSMMIEDPKKSKFPAHRLLRIGFDPQALSCATYSLYRRQLKGVAKLLSIKMNMQTARAVKSTAEIEVVKRAIRIAEVAFREALVKRGERATEKELALEIEFAARREGAEGVAFETIVASGKRGALVHARPSGGKLAGAVVIDWGIVLEGYCTDCTRAVAFGRVPTELRKAHHLVVEAQERALERIRPGVKAAEVDRAAREVLEKAGYGKAFGHGLGHGVGLEVHEKPHLGPRSMDVLERGMIITVEPGVYLPGLGGVRVEDMVLVTSSGAEVLTRLPRSLEPSDYV
ncbi:MAG: M24 family metallopeptidase [Actinomycetota bacterium]